MKNKIKFRTQQRMTHQKLCRTHPKNGSRMSRTRSQEITGPGGSRRVQKPKKHGPKPRNHGSTAELERKSHQKSHKKHGPDVTKTPPDKNPLF